ncbi:MAG: autotransporter-associated beta strand repeat-containing protein, partial [Kiritimatiellia bacterium]|nr:autotransporter-associated beta strand repeat-containing protein [Kiritimatiellia bacterium]
YYVKVFEYGGSSTEVNYLTSGTPLTGNKATIAAACVPAQVTLLQQIGYYSWFVDSASGCGYYNNGGTEVGLYAHADGAKQVAGWRTFNTSGNGAGDARALEPGDRFQISVHGYSPVGVLGMSLNDGAATGSWANRHSNTRGYVQCGNYGDMTLTDAGGSASWSSVRPWNTTLTLEFHVLSSKEFTANIVGQPAKYDRTMSGSPGDTDRIDGYSIYYADDYNGTGNVDAYWKQDTTITNLGYVEFGKDDGTRTIAGKITDGTDPHCTEVASPNFLKKVGSGTVTLNNTNTYTLYTDIAGGTLQIYNDSALGTPPPTESPLHLRFSAAEAALVAADSFTLNANRGITLSNWAFLAVADSKVLTYNGVITDGAGSYNIVKNQGGELILGGANTYDGGTYIDAGTLTLNLANAAGTGGLFVGMESGSLAATLNLGLATTYANNLTIRSGSSGIKYLKAANTATLSGTLAISETADDRFSIDVASGKTLTLSGVMSGDTGGGKITKTGAGTLIFSNAGNTHDKKVQINEGILSLSASRNLGADPGGIYENKLTLHGGTLQAAATFALHANVGISLGVNNGLIDVGTYTLTVPAPIIGAGTFGKLGAGTLLLTGANTFTGPMTNSAGTVQIGNNGTVGSLTANIVNNAALVWNRSDNTTYGGVISGTGTLEKKGAGILTLSGASTYSGNTTVSAGTLLISGSAANSAVTVASGATLMGDGPIGNLTIGGLVDPGNSAGARATLEVGAVTLQAGGSLRVDMSAVSGTAGTDWDLITASTIAVNSTGKFTIYPSGSPTGFDSSKAYAWTIIAGTVSGFDAGSFTVDTSNFSHDLGGGSFSIESGSLQLKFTPRTPDAPTAFSATATAADTIKLAFTKNSSNDPVVIVYNLDGSFGTPTGTVPAAGQTFAGGTVVYAGATSPQNHTGLTGCTKYYYAAWSYNGTTFSASGSTANETTATPAAPANVRASATNYTDFTAAWDAAAGASGYRLDVSTSENFSGVAAAVSTNFAQFDFPAELSLEPTFVGSVITSSVMSLSSGTIESNITTGTYFPDEPYIEETGGWAGTSQATAKYFTFTIYPVDGQSITITGFTFRAYATAAGPSAFSSDINGGACTYTVDAPSASIVLVQHTVTDVVDQTGAVVVKIQGWDNGSRTTAGTGVFRLDDVQISGTVGGAESSSYVVGYENKQVTAGTSVSVTGLAEETTYYFRVRSEGAGSCTSANSATKAVTTKTMDPPAEFSATANGVAQIDLTFATNAAQDNVVIVYNTTGVEDFTAPSGTPPAVGGSFAGGTLIYNGTGVSYNHTGLDPCGTYTYRAFSYNVSGSRWSTGLDADAETDAPAAPASVWANPTNFTDFTANWAAATGATGYRIDVSTSSNFTGSGGTILSEGFDTLTDTTPPTGWTASKGSDLDYVTLFGVAAPCFAFKNAGEWLTSPTFTAGATNVQFWTRGNGGGSSVISVSGLVSGVWTRMGAVTNSTIGANYNVALNAQATQLKFTFETKSVNSSFDDVVITGGAESYVTGYENKQVSSGTSQSVTGLAEDTTYYFRVRSEAGTCASGHSPTGMVKTKTSSVTPPEEFSATAVGATQVDLAFTANGSGNNVVIVYNTTGYGDFTAPSGAPAAVGTAFAGGTLIYNGTGTSTSHTGLDSCTKYYYRAFSYSYEEGVSFWSTGSDDDATTAAPAAPTAVWASVTNYVDFTATWAPVAGAAGYFIDVSESTNFAASSGGGGYVMLASNAATSPGAITNGWTGLDLSASSYVGMIKSTSVVTSPAFSTVGFTNLTVDCRARTFGGVDAAKNTITVSISSDNGVSWAVMGTLVPKSSTLTVQSTLTATTHLGYADTRIRWQTLGANGSIGVGVDRLVIQGWETIGGVGAYVPGFENEPVAGTSVSVTGLLEAATYYFCVRTKGHGACVSAPSPTNSVTTRSGSPDIPKSVTASDGTHTTMVEVGWIDEATNETGFVIWRHNLNTFGSATAIGTNAADDTSYEDLTAAAGQLYYYWVTATNTFGSSPRGEPDTGFRRLVAPTGASATDGASTDHVGITWTGSEGATAFKVYRTTGTEPAGAADLGALNSGALDTTAVPGQQYYYWIMAVAGSSSGTSDWSTADGGYRKLATVSGLTASYGTSSDKIALAWTDVLGETGYGIWQNSSNDSATATLLTTVSAGTVAYDDVTSPAGSDLYYWVTATNTTSASMGAFQVNGALGRRLDPNLPQVTTAAISGITPGGASGGGTVTGQGTTLVTERGVVWSVNPNPTVVDSKDTAASGGAGAFVNTLSGLTANQTYYVRAYAINAAGTAYGTQVSFATPCFSGPPTGLYAAETNGTDFTAAWAAVPGAVSYRLDASTNQYFLEGDSITTVISENFDSFTAVGGATDRSGTLNTFMQTAGWTGTAVYENGGEAKMGSGSTRGVLTTPTLNLSSNGGQAVFTFKARFYSASDASKVQVLVSTNNGTSYVQSGDDITLTGDMVTYTSLITNGTASCKVRLFALNSSNERYFLDDWKIEQGLGEPSFLTGYEDRLVTGTSQMVTELSDLSTNTWYYFRVRAEGNDGCVSGNSGTAPVQTRDLSPAAPGNVQASDGTSTAHVHVSWNDVAVADGFIIYRNSLDDFDTVTAIATNYRAGNTLLDENFTVFPGAWTNGGTAIDTNELHFGLASPCRALGLDDVLTSPPVNYPTQMTFRVSSSGSGNDKTTTNYYSLDGGASWLPIGSFTTLQIGATVTQVLTNSPNLSKATNVLFRFVSAFNTWYLDDVKVTGGSVTNFFDTTTDPGALWWYFVEATNSYGGNASEGDSGYRALRTVAGVNATDGTYEDRVAVTWTDLNGGETGYAIWRSETADTAEAESIGEVGANITLFDDTEALPGQPYYYWVRAANSSSESMSAWGTADVGYRKLKVDDFTASFNDYDDRVALTWTDSEGETGYILWRNIENNFGTASNIAPDIGADEISYNDEDAVTGTIYYYWLQASNEFSVSVSAAQAAGIQGRRAQVAPTVTTLPVYDNILLSAMSGGDILNAGGSAITNRGVVWNTAGLPTITDSHSPEVTISGDGLGTYASTIAPTTGGVVYYVRAFAQNGERIAYGQQVSFVAECSSELPTTLAATAVSAAGFTANWNPMGGVTSYRVDVSTNATFLGGYDANVAAWHNGILGEGTGGTWAEENLLQSAGYIALRLNSSTLGTPAMDFNTGTAETLTFKARIFGGGGNGDFRNKITVSLSTDGGTTWTDLGTRTPLNTTMTAMEPFDLGLVAGTNVRVRLQTRNASAGVGVGVVDVMVTNVLDPRGVFISGYSNLTVNAATSLAVTGLQPEVTYYYRVRAYISGACISGNSDVRPVTTPGYSAYWDSGGTGRNWTTPANWVGDELPRTNATVFFYTDNKTLTNVYLNGNQTVKGIRFTDNASISVNIASNSLTIFGGGIGVAAGTTGSHGIHSDIVLAEDQAWTSAAAVDFRVSGSVAGSRAITKLGAGRIVLSAHDSTFTGTMAVEAGALQIRGTNALGTTAGGTTVADGAALEVHGGGSSVRYTAEPLTLSGTGIANGGALCFLQNNVDFRGPITLAADTRIQAVLNSPTASGSIDIGAHTLLVGVEATELTLGGNLTGTRTDGSGAFVKDGSSRLILSGNNTNLTGVFRFNEGEIRIGTANAMGNTGTLIFGNNVVMKSTSVADFTISRPTRFAGNVTFGEETTRTGTLIFEGDVDLGSAMRTITVNHPVTKWTEFAGTLSNGGLTKAGAGLLVLSGTNTYSGGTTVSAGTLQGTTHSLRGNIANAAALVFWQDFDGTYSNILNGSGSLTKNGTGTLTLSGANTYSGLTMLNEGLMVVSGTSVNSTHLVGGGAHLLGTGTLGALIVDGTVHPGAASNTVGILKTGKVFLSPGGALRFDITSATGTAGVNWDLITCSDDITVDATELMPFTVQVVGAPIGFNAAVSKSWKIIDASAGVVNGFAANKFTVDATGFTSAMGGGGFTVTESGGDLYLEFQIPGVAVLGMNGEAIVIGDTTPSAADGTDFGSVSVGSAEVRTFFVTNFGGAELTLEDVTIGGTHATDFVVMTMNASTVAAGEVAPFAIAYSPAALGASAATVYLTNGVATSSPYTFALAGNGLIAGPTNLLVYNDGYEMIRLTWNKSSFDGMVVHRANAAPTEPVQHTSYAVGAACGGGRVLYKGALEEFEHVVPANSTNYYAVYSYSDENEYSAAARGFDITEAFEDALSYDPFSYTNGVALLGLSGGVGWSGTWSLEAGTQPVMGHHSLVAAQGFGTEQGNHLVSQNISGGQRVQVSRALSAANTTSNIYVGWVMNVPATGANRFAGVEVYGGAGNTTTLFRAGVSPGATNASLQYLVSNRTAISSIEIKPGEDYTFIAKYIKKDKKLHLLAYTADDIVSPEADQEPPTWHATLDVSGTASFYGVRLVASNGTATANAVKWDEIRVAKNWTNLFSEARAPVWKGSTGLLKSQWINVFNWVGNKLPYQTNDTCVFYRSFPYTGDISVLHLGNLYNYKGLKFNEKAEKNVNIRPVDYNIWIMKATNGLGLFADGIEVMEQSTGTHSLGNMTVRADQTWSNGSANVFTLAGYIKGLDFDVTKTGPGRVHLVGDNDSYFPGKFIVQQGPMSIGAHKSLGNATVAGWTAVEPGGALELRPTGATTYDAEPLRLAGLGVNNDGALRNVHYNNTWPGVISLTSSARINADTNTTLTLTGGINAIDAPHNLYFGGVGAIFVNNNGIGANVLNFIKDGTGTATLSRATAHTSATLISNGTLRLTLVNALPTSNFVHVASGATFDHVGYNQTIGSLEGAGTVQLGATRLTTGGNGSNTTWSGTLVGTGGLDKRGSSVMVMSGANSYSGSTTIDNGTLIVSGSAAYSAHLVRSAGTLMGDGPIGTLSIAAVVDAGNASNTAAILQTGAITLQASGSLVVDMAKVSGTAGTDWDLVNSYGGITSLANGTFVIRPRGNPTGFDASQNYTWTIMSGVSPVSGFNVNRFVVDASEFEPSLDGGLFSVSRDGNNLNLTFTTGSGIPIWDGEGADANWDTGANWVGDIAPMGEKVVFFYTGLYSGPTILLHGVRSVLGVRFTDQADQSLTFAGDRLNIKSGGIAIDANSEGAHTLNCLINLNEGQTWTNDSALSFTVAGGISGAQQLRKTGSGLVVLAANNTFSGGLCVDQGGVQLNSSINAMGTGGVTVGTNATVELNGAFNWRPSTTVLYGTGTNGGGAIRQISSGLGEWRGDITLGADSAIAVPIGTFNTYGTLAADAYTLYVANNYGFTMMDGQLTGTKTTGDGALHKSGSGNLFLRGA